MPVAALKGEPALELALRKLDTVGNFMMTTAHPDDENNAMLAYFSHGKGFRTSLVTATHGEGGQNEIGPELFVPLAVLRTEELLAAHRFDGAEQYFTRAIDFGFSFSVEETLEKWGHEEILGDYVRHDSHDSSRRDRRLRVRRRRRRPASPDLVAADARSVPRRRGSGEVSRTDQGRPAPVAGEEVLLHRRLWRPGGPGAPVRGRESAACPVLKRRPIVIFSGGAQFDPVLGRTYDEIAGEARSMHKCQGMSQLLPLPALDRRRRIWRRRRPGGVRDYRLRDTVLDGGVRAAEKEIFDGVDTSLRSLLSFAPSAPAELGAGLDRITAAVADARKALSARRRSRDGGAVDGGPQGAARRARVAGVDESRRDRALRDRFPPRARRNRSSRRR